MARSAGVRARLLLVVVVAVAPVVLLLVVHASAARQSEAERVREESRRFARLLADAHEEAAGELSALLRALAAAADEYGTTTACDALARPLATHPRADQMALAARDGSATCGPRPSTDAAPGEETRRYVHGDDPALVVAVGGESAVATGRSVLSLDRALDEALAHGTLPEGSAITLVGEGRVYARAPHGPRFVSGAAGHLPLLDALERRSRGGTFEADGLDGQRRLYGHAVVRGARPELDLVVGMPAEVAYERADRDRRRGLAAVAVTTAAALVATLLLADVTVGKPLRRIAGVARRMAGGDLDARTGLLGGDEIADVGAALDDLAASVAATNEQLERAGREREALLRELLAVQQDERRRLAEEIHDESIQALTAAGLRVQRLRRRATDDEVVAAAARDAEEAVGRAISDLRGLMGALVPEADDAPVAVQLRHVLQDAFDEGPVVWDLHVDLAAEPAPEVRSLLVRNVREAVRNAAQHAAARHVAVRVSEASGVVEVEVVDDGAGFDPAAPAADGELGLRAMRQRTERVGGFWRVTSRPGAGTTVAFGVPTE